ncbi:Sterol-4-alpha-carboxylate 3-dehydrogenase, decarboxylating [Botryosphaeria dothidea]|uniref:Sterol-4-alpha-carboxylate 3-dehydrogenase, decarboxylating n=1 Tax=Botryosphaeria dothidea TaxID=55169 RepID=A0A8H4J1R5_9PEZI|nr:Sterol-4-alpha-carboxylate 3-dehydrogenase, decarboxylating [Botryosphaeria dothidea]
MDNEHHHVLITGGCGFLGRAIVDAFLEQYPTHLYTILGLSPPLLSRQNVGFIQADIRDPAAVERALSASRPDAVVHAAGIVPTGQSRYSQREREHVFAVNVEGTRNLLSVAKSVGSVRAFVYTSSSTVVGDDLSSGDRPNAREEVEDVGRKRWIYGESKTHAENLVLSANDPSTPFLTTALRPSVLFGPGDTNLLPPLHALIAAKSTTVTLGNGFNLYDFTYVTNAADAHVLATANLLASASAAGLPINITNDAPIPFRDFCRAVWAAFGHHPRWEVHVPAGVARAMGSAADVVARLLRWQEEWGLSRGAVEDAVGVRYGDGRRAREVLGYAPRVGLAEGVGRACEDYKRVLAEREKEAAGKVG